MATQLYSPKRHAYINKNFDYITSASIKEYDMKSAGLNILIASGAIDEKTIAHLKSLPKHKRTVEEGLMQRRDKNISKIINDGLVEYRTKFIEANDISDSDIISVKRDAIFLVNKRVKYTKFDNVEFIPKNKYSSYYRIGRLEIYYSKRDDVLDIKGLKGRDNNFKQHENYIINFLKKLFKLNEISRNSACEYLRQFANDYRKLKLPIGYYREFNTNSLYRLNLAPIAGNSIAVDIIDDKKLIDITYNYIYIIMPLIKLIY